MEKYILLASGTRGDVQPYLALAQGLQRAGQRAVVATHANFRALVEAHGVEFRLLEGNPNELFDRPDTQSALVLNRNLAQTMRGSLQFLRQARPLYRRLLHSAWQVTQDAGAIIIGLPTLWGLGLAQKLNVPCFACLLQPLTRTRIYPTVFQPFQFSFAPYNYLTHLLLEQITWLAWNDLINAWRRELGLPPTAGLFAPLYQQRTPVLYGFSPRVFQRPADWPEAHTLTGYWFLDHLAEWTPPADLIKFIESAGTPPLFMGFGSMSQSDSFNTLRTLTAALTRTNMRAVITVNDSFQRHADLPPNIFPVTDVPHDWLFPRVSAVIHHGGAGTTGASLRAGVPTIISPVGVDQFFWGAQVAALGVGVKPLPRRALTVERLTEAIECALHDEVLKTRARELGAAIRSEDGVGEAVKIFGATPLPPSVPPLSR